MVSWVVGRGVEGDGASFRKVRAGGMTTAVGPVDLGTPIHSMMVFVETEEITVRRERGREKGRSCFLKLSRPCGRSPYSRRCLVRPGLLDPAVTSLLWGWNNADSGARVEFWREGDAANGVGFRVMRGAETQTTLRHRRGVVWWYGGMVCVATAELSWVYNTIGPRVRGVSP